jgi:hypothetical protein
MTGLLSKVMEKKSKPSRMNTVEVVSSLRRMIWIR